MTALTPYEALALHMDKIASDHEAAADDPSTDSAMCRALAKENRKCAELLRKAIAAQEPQLARSLAGLMPMGLHFDDADPVARCLVKDCQWHGHGDSVNDAVKAWTAHLARDHRRDWPED